MIFLLLLNDMIFSRSEFFGEIMGRIMNLEVA